MSKASESFKVVIRLNKMTFRKIYLHHQCIADVGLDIFYFIDLYEDACLVNLNFEYSKTCISQNHDLDGFGNS